MQIKTIGMAIIKKSDNKYWWGCELYTAGGNVQPLVVVGNV